MKALVLSLIEESINCVKKKKKKRKGYQKFITLIEESIKCVKRKACQKFCFISIARLFFSSRGDFFQFIKFFVHPFFRHSNISLTG